MTGPRGAARVLLVASLVTGCAAPALRSGGHVEVIRAEGLAATGRYAEAEASFREALGASPVTDRALHGLGRLYLEPGNPGRDYRRAHDAFNRLITDHPQSQWGPDARVWRDLLASLLAARREAERLRRDAERARVDRDRFRQDVDDLRLDLERLQKADADAERLRRR